MEERALDFDDVISSDSSFVELPEGDYQFTVENYERGRFNGSEKIPPCNQVTVYFRVEAPDGSSVSIREHFILFSRLEWKISQLYCSVGLKKEGEPTRMNWPALPGLTGMAHVTLDPDKNNPSRKYNHISRFYPKKETNAAPAYKAGDF